MNKGQKGKFWLITAVIILLFSVIAVYSFFLLNFKGVVVNKYIIESPLQSISIKSKHIVIKYWKGKNDFVINNDSEYEKIQIGQEYYFKKDIWVDWVSLR